MKTHNKRLRGTKRKKNNQIITSLTTSMSAFILVIAGAIPAAAAPAGADTAAYNALTDVVFWVAGIAIAAAGGIPSIIKIVQGQADEDPRGRNAGIAGAVVTGACVGALAVVRTQLF